MQVFFSSRDKARKASFGKLVDNGATAQHGKRFGRNVEAQVATLAASPAKRFRTEHIANCPISGRNVPVFVRGKNKL